MKILFNKVTIENFQGFVSKEFVFEDGLNIFEGHNGVGKTTSLSAMLWCLYGKDIYDRKKFDIFTIGSDGEVLKNDAMVQIEMLVDGKLYVIKRIYKNAKKAKTVLSVGSYDIENNLVFSEFTQSAFNTFIAENIIPEDQFKKLSNITFIPGMKWQDQRDFIFGLIEGVDDKTILLNGDYPLVENQILTVGHAKTQEANTKSINQNKKDKNDKKIEIELLTKQIADKTVATEDLKDYETKRDELQAKVSNYEVELQQNSEIKKTRMELGSKITNLTDKMNNEKSTIENHNQTISHYEELYTKQCFNEETLRNKELAEIDDKIDRGSRKLESYIEEQDKFITLRDESKTEGLAFQQTEIKIENNTCSVCGQTLPEEKQNEMFVKLQKDKNNKLQDMSKEFHAYKSKVEELKESIAKGTEYVETLKTNRLEVETKVYDIVDETEEQKAYKSKISSIKASIETCKVNIQTFKNEVDELLKKAEELPTVKPLEPIGAIRGELDDINQMLRVTDVLQDLSKDLKTKNDEYDQLCNHEKSLFDKGQQLQKFNEDKSKIIKVKLAEYFLNQEFITQEITQEGKINECFVRVNKNGIPYTQTNDADKLTMDLDIIRGVQLLEGKYVPVLIDNLERIIDFPTINTQVIGTKVVKQDIKQLNLIYDTMVAQTEETVKTEKTVYGDTVVIDDDQLSLFE